MYRHVYDVMYPPLWHTGPSMSMDTIARAPTVLGGAISRQQLSGRTGGDSHGQRQFSVKRGGHKVTLALPTARTQGVWELCVWVIL